MLFSMLWEGISAGPSSIRICSWLLLSALCRTPAICLVFVEATQLLIARACKDRCISPTCAVMLPDLAVLPMQCISVVQQALWLGGVKLTCCCLYRVKCPNDGVNSTPAPFPLRHLPSACSTWVYSRKPQPVACRQEIACGCLQTDLWFSQAQVQRESKRSVVHLSPGSQPSLAHF